MSASATSMHDFIEALAVRVPREVHPLSRCLIHEDLSEMRDRVDDPAYVIQLIANVRHRIARDLKWEAETQATLGHFKEAYRLRRRAAKFEAAHA